MFFDFEKVDWYCVYILTGFTLLWLVIAFYYRKANTSFEGHSVANRSLPFWFAGISAAATAFAADTPLWMSDMVRADGLYGLWFQWGIIPGIMLMMVVFAPLWRRSEVKTEVEFIHWRYGDGPVARFLRIFGGHVGFFINCFTIAWVSFAMTLIAEITTGLPKSIVLPFLIYTSAFICIFGGMLSVIMVDCAQWLIGIIISFSVAGIVFFKHGGFNQFGSAIEGAAEKPFLALLDLSTLLPEAQSPSWVTNAESLFTMIPTLDQPVKFWSVIIVLVAFSLGSSGNGHLLQRVFSTRNVLHSVMTVVMYLFIYVIMIIAWIVVGAGSIIDFPILKDGQSAYILMLSGVLGVYLIPIAAGAMTAAYQSTATTHLHIAETQLYNDILLPLLRLEGTRTFWGRFGLTYARSIVWMASFLGGLFSWWRPRYKLGQNLDDLPEEIRQSMEVRIVQGGVLLAATVSLYFAMAITSIFQSLILVWQLFAGTMLIASLRWLWWWINEVTEVATIASSLILNLVFWWVGTTFDIEFFLSWKHWQIRIFILMLVCPLIGLLVTRLVNKPPNWEQLINFCKRVGPPGYWGPVLSRSPNIERYQLGWLHLTAWASGAFGFLLFVFSVKWAVFEDLYKGLIGCVISAISVTLLIFLLIKLYKPLTESNPDQVKS